MVILRFWHYFVRAIMRYALAGLILSLGCNNKATTDELLAANFLASGQTRIDLLSPTENQQVTTANPTLSWSSRGVGLYTVEMATDSAFASIVLKKDVAGTSYTVANSDLSGVSSLATASYFWRVKVALITNNLQSNTGTFFLVAIPASGSGYAGALYVNGASKVSVQVGSKEAPYKRIQNAIVGADTLRNGVSLVSFDILIAEGTYSEEATLLTGISIRGGYNAAWIRNTTAYVTSINAPIDSAVKCGSGSGSSTWIEGLTIRGGTAGTSQGIYVNNSSPTISGNVIIGGTGTNNFGIRIENNSSPVIQFNVIWGGTGITASAINTGGSSP